MMITREDTKDNYNMHSYCVGIIIILQQLRRGGLIIFSIRIVYFLN